MNKKTTSALIASALVLSTVYPAVAQDAEAADADTAQTSTTETDPNTSDNNSQGSTPDEDSTETSTPETSESEPATEETATESEPATEETSTPETTESEPATEETTTPETTEETTTEAEPQTIADKKEAAKQKKAEAKQKKEELKKAAQEKKKERKDKLQEQKTLLHDKKLAAKVKVKDTRYSVRDYDGKSKPDSVRWTDRTDESKIVIIAPHATNHYRNGEPKVADAYTGGIAEVLGNRLGASVLTTTGKVSDWGDNWEGRDDEFTRILNGLPKDSIIIDLHGMDDDTSEADFEIGTGEDESAAVKELTKNIRDEFDGYTVVDNKFKATDSYTVTDHMQKLGYDTVQVEVSEKFRDPKDHLVGRTITALEKALSETAAGE